MRARKGAPLKFYVEPAEDKKYKHQIVSFHLRTKTKKIVGICSDEVAALKQANELNTKGFVEV